jgi:hypothetical protein
MTAREMMLAGELYDALGPELVEAPKHARLLLARCNATGDREALTALLGRLADDARCPTLHTATHPLDSAEQSRGLELAKPIVVGDDAWPGGGAIVLPGVTIGARVVVGAGGVVTRDVPAETKGCRQSCTTDLGRTPPLQVPAHDFGCAGNREPRSRVRAGGPSRAPPRTHSRRSIRAARLRGPSLAPPLRRRPRTGATGIRASQR